MYATRSLRMFRPTLRMRMPVPNEEHSAHTISQRLRRIREIPAELIPLGLVVGFAVCAAIYSSARHLVVDKTIRLSRRNRLGENSVFEGEGHEKKPEAHEEKKGH